MVNVAGPQAVYTKSAATTTPVIPPPPPVNTGIAAAPPPGGIPAPKPGSKRNRKTFMGIDVKSLGVAGGLIAFLVIGLAAVVTTLQLGRQESVAPTQPHAGACTLRFTVPAPDTGIACTKTSWRDELNNAAGSYQFIQQQTVFERGEVVVFRIELDNTGDLPVQISLADMFIDGGMEHLEFLDSTCGANAYNSTTSALTCPAQAVDPNETQSPYVAFRARVRTTATNGLTITNVASASGVASPSAGIAPQTTSCAVSVTLPMPTPTVSPSPSPTPTPTPGVTPTPNVTPTPSSYSCNSACTSNTQCATANNSYVCYQNRCRHEDYVTQANCQPPTQLPVGCNDVCVTNTDCDNAAHICYQTGSGLRCRLETNPTNPYCQDEVIVRNNVVYLPGEEITIQEEVETVVQQPVTTEELPVAGDNTKLLQIVAGAGTFILVGLGLILLL